MRSWCITILSSPAGITCTVTQKAPTSYWIAKIFTSRTVNTSLWSISISRVSRRTGTLHSVLPKIWNGLTSCLWVASTIVHGARVKGFTTIPVSAVPRWARTTV